MIPVVGPFASEAAVIIHHAYMGALAPHAELLRGADGEGDRRVAARAVTVLAIFYLDHPHVVVPYNIVSSIRHILLPESLGAAQGRLTLI
jgi:hypothetical protein